MITFFRMINPFESQQTIFTIQADIKAAIKDLDRAKRKLPDPSSKSKDLIYRIGNKIKAYDTEIGEAITLSHQLILLKAKKHFIKSVTDYLAPKEWFEREQSLSKKYLQGIKTNYFESPLYFPVGVDRYNKYSYRMSDAVIDALIKLNLIMFGAAFLLLLTVPVGVPLIVPFAVMAAATLLCLVNIILFSMNPIEKNLSVVKNEEEAIFEAIYTLVTTKVRTETFTKAIDTLVTTKVQTKTFTEDNPFSFFIFANNPFSFFIFANVQKSPPTNGPEKSSFLIA